MTNENLPVPASILSGLEISELGFEPVLTRLQFFGITVDVWSNIQDAADLIWMFSDQQRSSVAGRAPTDYQVVLKGEGGFFRSLFERDSTKKTFWTMDSGGLIECSEFSDWSSTASPLPPFRSARFRRRFALFPAAVVIDPSGNAVAIAGADHVGKTRTAIQLLAAGWCLMSESLAVVDVDTGICHAYYSALGLRKKTLSEWDDRTAVLSTKTTRSSTTGRVKLVRAEDLFPGQVNSTPKPLQKIYFLSGPEDDKGVAAVSLEELRVFPRENFQRVALVLPTVTRLSESLGATFANQIEVRQQPRTTVT